MANAESQDSSGSASSAQHHMKAVLVAVLADGAVSESEKRLVRRVQQRLGIADRQLAGLVKEVGQGGELSLPTDQKDRRAALELMVATAAIDGQVGEQERDLLERVALRMEITGRQWQELYDQAVAKAQKIRAAAEAGGAGGEQPSDADQQQEAQAEALLDEFYLHLAQWPDAAERATEFVRLGRAAVLPLIRAFESYRVPDRCRDVTGLRKIIAQIFSELGDDRVVYYLAGLLRLGDDDNELSNAELREAVAVALGKLVGRDFGSGSGSVEAARQWWQDEGHAYPAGVI